MPKQINPYPLRIDEIIFEKIRFIASEDGRSINKQIEYILKTYIEDYEKRNSSIEINLDNVFSKDK